MREGRELDTAVSDVAGTLMMVGAVVLAGGLLTAIVTDTLATAPAPAASFALAPVEVGDTSLRLSLKHGDPLPLDKIGITLQRGDASAVTVLPSDWTTPDPATLSAGERLSFALSPPAGANERLAVRVTYSEPSATLASLAATTGGAPAPLGPATLAAHLTPSSLYADGVAAAQLTVRVSHPAGASAIARIVADLHQLGLASGFANSTVALNDAGLDGDLVGGDGNWSALIRPPAATAVRVYDIDVNATSLDGLPAGRTTVALNITGNHGGSGGGGSGGSGGSVTGGTCYGCVVVGGASSYEGTRLQVPAPKDIASFRLKNWTWDRLHPDRLIDDALVIRVVNSSHGWSAYFTFSYLEERACITSLEVWSSAKQTVYVPPPSGTASKSACTLLEGLDLDMLDPTADGKFVRSTGAPHPDALYQNSGLTGEVTFILAYMRDEDPTSQKELAEAIGIYSVDVVMT